MINTSRLSSITPYNHQPTRVLNTAQWHWMGNRRVLLVPDAQNTFISGTQKQWSTVRQSTDWTRLACALRENSVLLWVGQNHGNPKQYKVVFWGLTWLDISWSPFMKLLRFQLSSAISPCLWPGSRLPKVARRTCHCHRAGTRCSTGPPSKAPHLRTPRIDEIRSCAAWLHPRPRPNPHDPTGFAHRNISPAALRVGRLGSVSLCLLVTLVTKVY